MSISWRGVRGGGVESIYKKDKKKYFSFPPQRRLETPKVVLWGHRVKDLA